MALKWQKFNNNQLVIDTLNEVIAKRKDVQGLIITVIKDSSIHLYKNT